MPYRSRSRSRSRGRGRSPAPPPPPPPLLDPLPPPLPAPAPRKRNRLDHPQKGVDQFWKHFYAKTPGKVTSVLPNNPYAKSNVSKEPTGIVSAHQALKSYNEAAAECRRDVERIVRECRRINQRYRDPHFDIEIDLKTGMNNCIYGLDGGDDTLNPKGVKRVWEIFDDPQFYINKATSTDIRQGQDGDCWLMSALCSLGTKAGLIDKVCVAQDPQVGVYGFVFYRDGEWRQSIIDDKLYLLHPDWEEAGEERRIWTNIDRKQEEEEYLKAYQRGSRALYFASCLDENETWLPLLEKAYAKIHGDYAAIESGHVGEGIEDLTGGVTSELLAADILDRDKFWNEELSKVNDEFLFGCSTGYYSNWLTSEADERDIKGIIKRHAYSIIDAKEVKGHRLVKLRNPWGDTEWTGAWSDGSKQWTAEWLQLLNHEFGNDGIFWMSYEDLLRKYQHLDRTRLFDESWAVTQLWATLNIPWSADYHGTKFLVTLEKESPVVIVLSQLDTRYFKSLDGRYSFTLSFRIQREGDDDEDYIVRSHGNVGMKRSVNTDIILPPGNYFVLLKITAFRKSNEVTIEEIIRAEALSNPDKLLSVGLSYDLAHSKGQIVETEEEKQERLAHQAKVRAKDRQKRRDRAEKNLRKQYDYSKKQRDRDKRRFERSQQKRDARAAKRGEGEPGFYAPDMALSGSAIQQPNEEVIAEQQQSDPTSKGISTPPPEPIEQNADVAAENSAEELEQAADKIDTPEAIEPVDGKTSVGLDGEIKMITEPGTETKEASQSSDDDTGLKEDIPIAENQDSSSDTSEFVHDTANSKKEGVVHKSQDDSSKESPPTPDDAENGESRELLVPSMNEAEKPDLPENPDSIQGPLPYTNSNMPPADLSDVDSWPDFDFDSELDMPPEPSSDGESEDNNGPGDASDAGGNDDDPDPWNAVCVVGLRVYSHVKDANVTVQLVKPRRFGEADALDCDDPSKGMVTVDGDIKGEKDPGTKAS